MSKRKPEEKKGSSVPEYMATYGDLVTLLMCFFVLLYAMSNLDTAKFNAMAASFAGPPKPIDSGSKDTVKDLLGSGIMQMPTMKEIKSADENEMKEAQDELAKIASELASDFKTYAADKSTADKEAVEKIVVELMDDSVKISFPDGIFFISGSAQLLPQAEAILDVVGDELTKYPGNDILIEGHTDNRAINTPQFPNNRYLSAARAISVGTHLEEKKNIPPSAILEIGRGEHVPVATNDTEEGRAKNRRVEISIKSSYYSSGSTK